MPPRRLAIDLGQSGIRMLHAHGKVQRVQYDDVGITALLERAAIADLARRIGRLAAGEPAPDDCAVGLTGFVDDRQLLAELEEQLRHAVGTDRIVIASDVVTAYLGCLGEESGVTMIWGTGSVALAADGRGTWTRVDGRGHALGDHGSGYWIGHRGLLAALDWLDERGGSPGLARRAEKLGTPNEIFRRAYAPGASTQFVAAFAVAVLEAAEDGDEVADGILDAAVREVVATIASAARILPESSSVAVGLTGGLSQAGDLAERLRTRLSDRIGTVELSTVRDAPLEGALRLAARPELRRAFPGLVHPRTEGP